MVPAADLEAETLALAERLCANAPVAQRVIKEIGWRSMMGQMGWTEAVRFGETMRRASTRISALYRLILGVFLRRLLRAQARTR